jgi:hypothetical protein
MARAQSQKYAETYNEKDKDLLLGPYRARRSRTPRFMQPADP